MGGEGGVVTAAVLGVEDEGQVQDFGLELGILAVRPQDEQNVLRRGEVGLRVVDIQAVAVVIVAVGLVAVDRQKRKQGDELQTLPQHVFSRDIVGVFVIGIQREDTARQGVHHVRARRLHDDVPHEAGGQGAVIGEYLLEFRELLPGRQFTE